MISFVVLLSISSLPIGHSAPSPDSSCPVVPIVKNFQADKYLGRWFEIQRFPTPFQSGGECTTADYKLLPNCSIQVTNANRLRDGSFNSVEGFAHSAGDPTRGSLTVEFPQSGSPAPVREGNYNVLATDYSNYAVVYSCFSDGTQKRELSWILARRPRLNPDFIARLHSWLDRLGVNIGQYSTTNHVECQYPAL